MYRNHVGSVSTTLLVVANLLVPAAILIFATGFFPYKPFLPGLAQYDHLEYGSPPEPPFDRLVFMVVDALRSDFVYLEGSGFKFTQNLISNGVAIPYTAHATSPTITMPRLKAITTGSTPSFLDAILSFDEADTSSTLAVQDTWLAQLKAKDAGKLVMYGDDTWLKLFPGVFDRADGTSSFFVSDFTEVDNNVTRHIADELRNDDWNTMVLHYLGLDHIGHKTGPQGPNMVPKQQEMDDIVRQIYEAMEKYSHLQSTLLVMCGDHGMNDAGNHGASSPGETSAALVFVSPKLKKISRDIVAPAAFVEDFQYYSVVEQSDLAPTLAALLGFPVPKNNLGSFIPDFLPFWPETRDQFQILLRNAKQILNIITATMGESMTVDKLSEQDCLQAASTAETLICEWQDVSTAAEEVVKTTPYDEIWSLGLFEWLTKAQTFMSTMASNYDMDRLTAGGVLATVASSAAVLAVVRSVHMPLDNLVPLSLITILYGIMMFASSYVEEEQHFWYWSTSTWLFYLTIKRQTNLMRGHFLMVCAGLGLMRVIRSWNQAGQKWAGEPDIVTMFIAPTPAVLWALVIASYGMAASQIYFGLKDVPRAVSGSVVSGVVISALSFKVAFTREDAPELIVGLAKTISQMFEGPTLVTRARAVFMGIGLTALHPLYLLWAQPTKASKEQAMHILHHLYTLLALTQSRITNAPMFLLFQGMYLFLDRLDLDPVEVTTSSLLLQFASYFAMGGTNAISGIDLSSAYNGVSGFNIVAIGILTFISNWAAPIWWTSASNLLLLKGKKVAGQNKADAFRQHIAVFTVFTCVSLTFVMGACTALRSHLFIWTVFSPKYLYSMAWSLGQHLVINIGVGGVLYWLGCR
ncbi:GPI ethanolamine phosphate transferase [Xylariaceae sp. FL0016]|nr:GPI ethanolamine phosphate transferase [Xylariaceae sp. FL0016]